MQIITKSGNIEGKKEGRLYEFKGIPYAKAGRFLPPQPYSWEGILDCKEFGKKAIQVYDKTGAGNKATRDEIDEDCLNLNIYTPSLEGKLPVVIYIHGGAFQDGSNQTRSGADMIRDNNFIYVSVNYRLGVLGYLYLGERLGQEYQNTGNLGTLDQLAAVRWVYENIEFFGGDPTRMTIMGESAGAKSIGALLMIPQMKTYCAQACLASGASQSTRDTETAANIADRFFDIAKKQGRLSGPEDVFDMPVDDIIEVQRELCSGAGSTCMFGPVADGVVLPKDWTELIHSRDYWRGKAIIGSCKNELMFYKYVVPDFLEKAPEIAKGLFGENARIAEQEFEELSAGAQEGQNDREDLWVRILTDYMYRTYSARLAQILFRNDSEVWYYSMEFEPAMHCFDQMIAFEPKADIPGGKDVNEKGLRILGEKIYKSYVRFFEHGDPNWEGIPVWKKLSADDQKMLVWDEGITVRDVKADDTLNRFPDYVFKL